MFNTKKKKEEDCLLLTWKIADLAFGEKQVVARMSDKIVRDINSNIKKTWKILLFEHADTYKKCIWNELNISIGLQSGDLAARSMSIL